MSDKEPAAELVLRYQAGNDEAAGELLQQYSQRLARLAARMLSEKMQVRESPEDIVGSVFRTFIRRTHEGEFHINHTTALWKLLAQITRRKVLKKVSFHTKQRRDVRHETSDPDQQLAAQLLDHEANETDASELIEELDTVLRDSDSLTQAIVHRLLNGDSLDDRNRQLLHQQLGREFDCSEFTVERRLKYLKSKLTDRLKKLRE